MSKVASYLQEHIAGEVFTSPALLQAMSHDMSILEITPEMVIYPRVTNDVRKAARFAWQLAEKKHFLPITARGNGTDQTGAAIGSGIMVVFPAHMNHILEFDVKQKMVRLQPGVNAGTLHAMLMSHGVSIPSLPSSMAYSTIGGAVLNNASGPLSGKYGDMRAWTHQLEVVLANGDLIQTGRLSKRELSKRKGLSTFEGEIYRGLDNLIEDNQELIVQKLTSEARDNVGYSSLAYVKGGDGSFDLTPLIVGSQGTLGIVSEMIMKSEFMSTNMTVAILACSTHEIARDMLDHIEALEPTLLDYYDGELVTVAATAGKKYDFLSTQGTKAVILVGFDDFSERTRHRQLKRLSKLAGDSAVVIHSADGEDALELLAIREMTTYSLFSPEKDVAAPPLVDGAYVPRERFEEFLKAVAALSAKYHVTMPVHSRVRENILYARPALHMQRVGDRQKIFKLIDDYSTLVEYHGGHLIGEDGEGRVKARAHAALDDDVRQLFGQVKALFDPHGILNPGVKQYTEPRELVGQLRSQYDTNHIAGYMPYY